MKELVMRRHWLIIVFLLMVGTALPLQAAGTSYVEVTSNVNARRAPNTLKSNTPIEVIPKGAILRVIYAGGGWYRIVHDSKLTHPEWRISKDPVYVHGSLLRVMSAAELTPILPPAGATQKIVISRGQRMLWFYQDGVEILKTPVSLGRTGMETPLGDYKIQSKWLTRQMQGVTNGVAWSLFVPYTMFFNGNVALHGTYWHDDFGEADVSHGCVNVPMEVAKEIYRRTNPIAPLSAPESVAGGSGATQISVIP